MSDYAAALEKIQELECPTGSLERNIVEILTDYNIAEEADIQVERQEDADRDGAQAYRVDFDTDGEGRAIIVLARSGADDYVARVTGVTLLDYKKLS